MEVVLLVYLCDYLMCYLITAKGHSQGCDEFGCWRTTLRFNCVGSVTFLSCSVCSGSGWAVMLERTEVQ